MFLTVSLCCTKSILPREKDGRGFKKGYLPSFEVGRTWQGKDILAKEPHLERPGGDIVHLAPLVWMKFLKCSQNHLG